jgi:hypothetical protein
LKGENGGLEILQEYLEDLTTIPEDLTTIQVNSLRYPYREMTWIFARVVRQESTATIH